MGKEAAARTGPSATDQSTWLEAAIRVPAAEAERLGALLVAAGSEGVITATHELGRGTRRRAYETVRGFFPAGDPVRARLGVDAALNELRRTIRRRGRRAPVLQARWLDLDARLWEMDWREHFRAIAVGRSLVVVPPWDRTPQPERRRIVIHPGMAFGTGQHATTHACLEAIEALTEPPPARALDIGTGTGVLAIALAKRGVRHVRAIDVDPHAVAAARDNIRRNRVGTRVRVSVRPLAPARGSGARAPARHPSRYPLIVANLYVDALVALAPTLAARVTPGGHLVTSGVLRTQQARLRTAYGTTAWRVVRARRRGTWVTTIFERRDQPARPRGVRRPRR